MKKVFLLQKSCMLFVLYIKGLGLAESRLLYIRTLAHLLPHGPMCVVMLHTSLHKLNGLGVYVQVFRHAIPPLQKLILLKPLVLARVTGKGIDANEQKVHRDRHGPDVGALIQFQLALPVVYFELLG